MKKKLRRTIEENIYDLLGNAATKDRPVLFIIFVAVLVLGVVFLIVADLFQKIIQ